GEPVHRDPVGTEQGLQVVEVSHRSRYYGSSTEGWHGTLLRVNSTVRACGPDLRLRRDRAVTHPRIGSAHLAGAGSRLGLHPIREHPVVLWPSRRVADET